LQKEIDRLYNVIRVRNETIKILEISTEGLHKQLAAADEEIKKLKADVAIGGKIIVGARCMAMGTSLTIFSYALWDGSQTSVMVIVAIWLLVGGIII
jgi:hypothetical protein